MKIQEYKDMIVDLFKSGMSLVELSSEMVLQNQQSADGLKM